MYLKKKRLYKLLESIFIYSDLMSCKYSEYNFCMGREWITAYSNDGDYKYKFWHDDNSIGLIQLFVSDDGYKEINYVAYRLTSTECIMDYIRNEVDTFKKSVTIN